MPAQAGIVVLPAQAGIQDGWVDTCVLDPGLRRGDEIRRGDGERAGVTKPPVHY